MKVVILALNPHRQLTGNFEGNFIYFNMLSDEILIPGSPVGD